MAQQLSTLIQNNIAIDIGAIIGTVPILRGGTGATTAAGVLASLGAYASNNPNGYTNNTGTLTSMAALTLGTTGTDVGSTVATGSTTPVVTLNIPTASAANRGVLSTADWSTFNGKQATLTFTPENVANKGAASGYAPLDATSKISSTYLPSYVDDVLEYANLAALPVTGTAGLIYVTVDTNKTYRWSGSAYVEISASPGSTDAVTEGTTNKYYTDTRARAALSATQNITYNSSTGVITGPVLSGYAPLASPTFTGTTTVQGLTLGLGANAVSTNTAVGVSALASNTTGSVNTAVGASALNANTTGIYNTALGVSALAKNVSGDANVAVGPNTLLNNISGSNNTGIGTGAITNNTGASNIGIGYTAGSALTTGNNNTIIGNVPGTAGLSDTVIIAAGSAERMRIDSWGNLYNNGVIQAQIAGAAILRTYNSQADNVLVNAPIGTVDFIASTGGKYSSVKGIVTSAFSDQVGLAFYTTSGSTYSEKMRIDSTGNVGIGVSPSAWAGSTPAMLFGTPGAGNSTYPFIASTNSQALSIGSNTYWNGSVWKAQFSSPVTAMRQDIGYNSITWHIATAVTQNTTQVFTQVMGIDIAGNVGIGTTSPAVKLDVYGVGGALSVVNPPLQVWDTTAVAANIGGGIAFGGNYNGSNKTNWAGIAGLKENATAGDYAGYLAFYSRPNGSNNTERMRIDSSGNVGIGTSSPGGVKLNIRGDSSISGNFLVLDDTATTNRNGVRFRFQSTGIAHWNMGIPADVDAFTINGWAGAVQPEYFRIDAAGNVTQKQVTLTSTAVNGSTSYIVKANSGTANEAGSILYFANYGPPNTQRAGSISAGKLFWRFSQPTSGALQEAAYIDVQSDGAQNGEQTQSSLIFGTAPMGGGAQQRMRIDSGGNVIVGNGSSVQGIITAKGTIAALDSSESYLIQMYTAAGVSTLSAYSAAGQALAFNTNVSGGGTSEKMRITASGNMLIGTATDGGYKLQVNGSFAATTKSFVIEHPTKPGMQLRYGSLEGPENGVYVRGKLVSSNKIELPEYWTKLVDPASITVNLTSIGKSQNLYVEDISNNVITLGGDNINCFYIVYGERVDVDKLVVEF